MTTTQGKLVSKIGADGLIGVGNIETSEGLALKIVDGSSFVRNKLIVEVLRDLNWLNDQQVKYIRSFHDFSTVRLNTQGKEVGHYSFNLHWAHKPLT